MVYAKDPISATKRKLRNIRGNALRPIRVITQISSVRFVDSLTTSLMTKPAPLRVSFLTNITTEVNQSVLESLLDSRDVDLVHVYFFDTFADTKASLLTTIQRFGLRRVADELFRLTLRKLQKRLSKFRRGHLQPRNCLELATQTQIPFSIIPDMNEEASREHLTESGAEYLVVCVCKNILRKPVLEIPKCTAINIHPSLLPEYRGPVPTYWIRKHERSQTGVTIHLMTPGIDNGPILTQVAMPLSEADNVRAIETRLFELAAKKLPGTLRGYHDGTVKPRPQDENRATYYGFPQSKS
jgi:folate-dependent phosphoribosylglycinamide formyltransferase PurN